MKKNVVICFLIVMILWLAISLVRVENQRYALSLGMCADPPWPIPNRQCLRQVETRTSPLWHLFYALTDS